MDFSGVPVHRCTHAAPLHMTKGRAHECGSGRRRLQTAAAESGRGEKGRSRLGEEGRGRSSAIGELRQVGSGGGEEGVSLQVLSHLLMGPKDSLMSGVLGASPPVTRVPPSPLWAQCFPITGDYNSLLFGGTSVLFSRSIGPRVQVGLLRTGILVGFMAEGTSVLLDLETHRSESEQKKEGRRPGRGSRHQHGHTVPPDGRHVEKSRWLYRSDVLG